MLVNVIHNWTWHAKVDNRNAACCERPAKIFIQVDAYTNTKNEMFEQWLLTAKTYLNCDDWITLFKEVGYEGDYFWTLVV